MFLINSIECHLMMFIAFLFSDYIYMQLSTVSRLKNDHFVALLGYCLEADNRILVYEFATSGSLHDVLHGMLINHSID